MDAFDLADQYRTPVMILADGMMGQMMEPVIFKKPNPRNYPEKFMLRGAGSGKSKFIRGLLLDPIDSEGHNWKLARKYAVIAQHETRHERSDRTRNGDCRYGTGRAIAKSHQRLRAPV